MKLYKKTVVTEYIIDNVHCNCCGKAIAVDKSGNLADYLSVEKRWGYGTTLDNCVHSFDLCEKCYKKIISQFSIPPDK